MTQKKIILVEDDQKKIEDLKAFLANTFEGVSLSIRESYQSGLRDLVKKEFDFLLLDMSIPTWDRMPNKASGDFQKFGGYTILQELKRKDKLIPTVLISMFDEFGESDRSITLQQLNGILKEEFPSNYIDAIYYSSSQSQWKDELRRILEDYLR